MIIRQEPYAITGSIRFTKVSGMSNGSHQVADIAGARLFVDTIQGQTCVVTLECEGDTYYISQYDMTVLLTNIAKSARAIRQEIQNGRDNNRDTGRWDS